MSTPVASSKKLFRLHASLLSSTGLAIVLATGLTVAPRSATADISCDSFDTTEGPFDVAIVCSGDEPNADGGLVIDINDDGWSVDDSGGNFSDPYTDGENVFIILGAETGISDFELELGDNDGGNPDGVTVETDGNDNVGLLFRDDGLIDTFGDFGDGTVWGENGIVIRGDGGGDDDGSVVVTAEGTIHARENGIYIEREINEGSADVDVFIAGTGLIEAGDLDEGVAGSAIHIDGGDEVSVINYGGLYALNDSGGENNAVEIERARQVTVENLSFGSMIGAEDGVDIEDTDDGVAVNNGEVDGPSGLIAGLGDDGIDIEDVDGSFADGAVPGIPEGTAISIQNVNRSLIGGADNGIEIGGNDGGFIGGDVRIHNDDSLIVGLDGDGIDISGEDGDGAGILGDVIIDNDDTSGAFYDTIDGEAVGGVFVPGIGDDPDERPELDEIEDALQASGFVYGDGTLAQTGDDGAFAGIFGYEAGISVDEAVGIVVVRNSDGWIYGHTETGVDIGGIQRFKGKSGGDIFIINDGSTSAILGAVHAVDLQAENDITIDGQYGYFGFVDQDGDAAATDGEAIIAESTDDGNVSITVGDVLSGGDSIQASTDDGQVDIDVYGDVDSFGNMTNENNKAAGVEVRIDTGVNGSSTLEVWGKGRINDDGLANDLAIVATGGPITINNNDDGEITGRINLTGSDDTFNNFSNDTWYTEGESDFGAGSNDQFFNSGRTRFGEDGATFVGLEFFNNFEDGLPQDGGIIDMWNDAPDQVLSTSGDYDGGDGSYLWIDADLVPGGDADRFDIAGNGAGQTLVRVNNLGSPFAGYDPDGVLIVDVDGTAPTDAFILEDGPIDVGFFNYDIFYEEGSALFFLRNTPNSRAYELPRLITGAQEIWHANQLWLERTADLRVFTMGENPSAVAPGLWLRGSGAWYERDASDTLITGAGPVTVENNYDQDIYGIQGGLDFAVMDDGENGMLLLGGLAGWVTSEIDFDSGSSADLDGPQFGLYGTYLNGGFFADLLFKVDLLEFDYSSAGQSASGDVTSYGVVFDTGYRVDVGDGFFVEPQGTLAYVHTDFDGFNMLASNVNFHDSDSFRGRIGGRVGGSFDVSENVLIEPFLTASAWHEFDGDANVTLSSPGGSITIGTEADETWGTAGGGINVFDLGNGISGFARADYRFGDDTEGVTAEAGIRINFGGGAPAPVEMMEPEPQPVVQQAQSEFMVFFDWDEARLTSQANGTLDEVVVIYDANGFARVNLAGHTDTSGPASYNVGLSERRAESVRQGLVARGVAPDEIVVRAFGESEPLVPTPNGVREPQNRRVEIVLM